MTTNSNHRCDTCAFAREGSIRDRYSHAKGWITHTGIVCHLHPPFKGVSNPVDPDGICSRWTDAETLDQPLAHLCPQVVYISQPTSKTPDTGAELEA